MFSFQTAAKINPAIGLCGEPMDQLRDAYCNLANIIEDTVKIALWLWADRCCLLPNYFCPCSSYHAN